MIMYGTRASDLRSSVLKWLKMKLDEKGYDIWDKHKAQQIEHVYLSDYDYTRYILCWAYKDKDGYFVRGQDTESDDIYDFDLDWLPLDILCQIADEIFIEPIKNIPDDFRGKSEGPSGSGGGHQ
jgi:hypothetical protein